MKKLSFLILFLLSSHGFSQMSGLYQPGEEEELKKDQQSEVIKPGILKTTKPKEKLIFVNKEYLDSLKKDNDELELVRLYAKKKAQEKEAKKEEERKKPLKDLKQAGFLFGLNLPTVSDNNPSWGKISGGTGSGYSFGLIASNIKEYFGYIMEINYHKYEKIPFNIQYTDPTYDSHAFSASGNGFSFMLGLKTGHIFFNFLRPYLFAGGSINYVSLVDENVDKSKYYILEGSGAHGFTFTYFAADFGIGLEFILPGNTYFGFQVKYNKRFLDDVFGGGLQTTFRGFQNIEISANFGFYSF